MENNKFRKNKTITILSVCILMLCTITSCAKTDSNSIKEIPVQETSPAETETDPNLLSADSDIEDMTKYTEKSAQNVALDLDGWELAYYEYINALVYINTMVDFESCTYSLIYVDDDDIPELVIDTGISAGGCIILTWHDNQLDDLQIFRGNFNYIERGNLLCNSDGNMGHYYDIVSTIQDGKWVCLFDGTYEDGADGPTVDDEGNFIYDYAINEENICKEDYMEKLNAVYPSEQAIQPEEDYVWIDILSVLENGDVASTGHRYELIIEDLSWSGAESACRAKGGYLATLTSFEEWDRVTAQITSEGKEDITFWVGAKQHKWSAPRIENGYDIFFSFWAEEEPSYKGLWENGIEMEEDCAVLFYNKSDDSYYLNDVPNYLLYAAPSYTGKIGYICEYGEMKNNITINNKILFLSAYTHVLRIMTSCIKTDSAYDTETATENAEESISVNTPDLDGWALAYYEYIKAMTGNIPEIAESYTYRLLYVDDDDIPELLINTGYVDTFLTWHDGTLDDFSEPYITYNYLEKDNLLFSSSGRMGYYLDMISTIQDGKWVHITVGTWNEAYDDSGHILLDEEEQVIYEYIWNGESVSEAEYTDRLNTAYHPFEQAAKSDVDYVWDDILSIWETGDVASAGHRYELIIEDLSWTGAESACRAKGGYLATLTTFEEWDRVTAQITSEGKDNITFWVGAKRHDWAEPGIEGGYDIFDSFWAEGEPSYSGLWVNNIKMYEDYTVLFYNKSDDRYYLNDVPNYLLYAAPFYTGKIGYICEYDE